MNNFEIRAEIPPRRVWESAATRRFVLIGDGDHGRIEDLAAPVDGLQYLFAHGTSHVGLEAPTRIRDALGDFFQAEPEDKYAKEDAYELLLEQGCEGGRWSASKEEKQQASHLLRLYARIRKGHITPHFLHYEDEIAQGAREGFSREELFSLRQPSSIEEHIRGMGESPAEKRYREQEIQTTKRLDQRRATVLFNAAGEGGKVACFFGAGHYREGDGINAFLPEDEQVLVFTASLYQAKRLIAREEAIARIPDFIIDGRHKAYVTSAAVERGLWL